MENPSVTEIEDLRQSPAYGRYMESIGWKVVKPVFMRKLGPVAIAKIQRTRLPLDWLKISGLLKKHRVFMCKLEPLDSGPLPPGFRPDSWPLVGSKTLRVDLQPSQEEILASFKKDCRYILKKFQISNFKFQINDFAGFYDIWRQSAKRKNLWIPKFPDYQSLIRCFTGNCFSLTLEDQAGAFILIHDRVAYYYYAGATAEGNSRNLPYLVVWESMQHAKKLGCATWDFEGIYDSRWPNRGWEGFSHFKKSFGGREISFPGCFSLWRLPL